MTTTELSIKELITESFVDTPIERLKKLQTLQWLSTPIPLTLRDFDYHFREFCQMSTKTPINDMLQLKAVLGGKA